MTANVEVLNEVPENETIGEWTLFFQKCIYHYDDGSEDHGYRFIWKDPDGKLRPQRGQARIPDKKALDELITQAIKAGWWN